MKKVVIISMLVCACSARQAAPTEPADEPAPQVVSPPTAPAADAGAPGVDGAELYGRICVTCHGAAGDGKGLGQQLFSFGTPEDQWKNGPTLEGITKTLAGGVHGSSMKPFPDFNEEQLGALAEHVLGLREALLAAETPD